MLDNIQNLRWRDFQKIDVTPFPFRPRLGAEEQKLNNASIIAKKIHIFRGFIYKSISIITLMSPPPRRAGVARHWLPLLHSGAEVMSEETIIQAVLSDRPSADK